jgi:hypothetical protein
MTVPIQAPPSPRNPANLLSAAALSERGTQMSMLQPPRSRFMINDILSGAATNGLVGHNYHPHHHLSMMHHNENDGRSPSPQGPRDLSVPPGGRHDDSDSDSSDQSDGCSNGEYFS